MWISAVGAAQASEQLVKELQLAAHNHRRLCEESERLHREQMQREKARTEEQFNADEELFRHEMKHITELSRRDSVRDLTRHASQQAYFYILINALLANSIGQIVSQLNLSPSAKAGSLVAISIITPFGFACIIVSIALSLELRRRVAEYNVTNVLKQYRCGRVHPTFESYYACHGASIELWATRTLRGGASLTFVAGACFGHSLYVEGFGNAFAGSMFCLFCGLIALLFLVGEVLYDRVQYGAQKRPQ